MKIITHVGLTGIPAIIMERKACPGSNFSRIRDEFNNALIIDTRSIRVIDGVVETGVEFDSAGNPVAKSSS